MKNLPFPKSLLEFQQLFPNDAACAAYMEQVRWPDGFVCSSCAHAADPFRFAAKPQVLRCRACRKDTYLMSGTIMQDSHTSLLTWFWGAYLVASLTFRFNRRFYPFNSFRSILGIGSNTESLTYAELYDADCKHPSFTDVAFVGES